MTVSASHLGRRHGRHLGGQSQVEEGDLSNLPSTPERKATKSTGMALGFYSMLATPWSW